MKPSKFSISILITALSVSTIFVASVFTIRSTQASRARTAEPISSIKPIKGLSVVFDCPKCIERSKTQTDVEGSFTIGDLPPGPYQVSLQCNAPCQSLNDISAGNIQFTLTGAKESPFKRNITKQQLVAGVKFPFEIVGGGTHALKGIVSLLK